ncbi:MAG: pyruvate formate-lyase-activating protein [Lachnospiraceae bacterium]|nr:pyruvate formate-lyase-activating protein [Lachnospiraceae bacterium]
MEGFIHSIETFGAVDGPGVRFVVFFQGCPMRCAYCHNPDTQAIGGGNVFTSEELWEKFERNEMFYRNGGITATGGEPLAQIDFLTELFTLFNSKGIHTCLDTSGILFNDRPETIAKFERLLPVTDLVMLDIKHIRDDAHRELTGHGNENVLKFARYLSDAERPVWIRHVVVPGINDSEEDLSALGDFLATLKNLKALDVLPYHTMGVKKYKELGIPYRLEGVPAMSTKDAVSAKKIILRRLTCN